MPYLLRLLQLFYDFRGVENKGKYNFFELNVTCVIEIDQIAASKISNHLFTSENRVP